MFAYHQIPRSGLQHALLFEWFLASKWAGLDWFQDFGERLDGDDMAFIVAAYRTHMQEEAVLAWYQHRRKR